MPDSLSSGHQLASSPGVAVYSALGTIVFLCFSIFRGQRQPGIGLGLFDAIIGMAGKVRHFPRRVGVVTTIIRPGLNTNQLARTKSAGGGIV